MTAACGFAMNYAHLLLARIGVGIGEAACVPPAQSAMSDYFPADRRASALAIFALGIPFGSMLASFGGGWLTGHFDWRSAFLLLGAPGLLVAILFKLTVREPPRTTNVKAPGFGETIKALARKPSFWHMAMAGALIAFVGYGSAQFLPSHMVRNYDLLPEGMVFATPMEALRAEAARAAYAFGIVTISTAIGTFMGGFLADRLSHRHPNVVCWLPALGMAGAIPFYLLSFMQTEFMPAFGFLLVAPLFHYLYLGPMFAVTQNIAAPRMRATASAIALFIVNLIGYGLGPPFVGAANDFFANQILQTQGLSLAQCADGANAAACAAADAQGLKYALGSVLFAAAWAGVHFMLAARTYSRDRAS
jgi:MFS family permease